MAGGVVVKVAFNPSLQAMSDQFGNVNVKGPLQDEINKILSKIERYGKQLAPVGTPESTHQKNYHGGRLRGSIQTSPLQDSQELGGMVSTNVDYAIYVHEGTRKMRARPFLETAANLINPSLEGQIGARLDEEFTRHFKTL